jgi:hypothetical protein
MNRLPRCCRRRAAASSFDMMRTSVVFSNLADLTGDREGCVAADLEVLCCNRGLERLRRLLLELRRLLLRLRWERRESGLLDDECESGCVEYPVESLSYV